MSGARTEDDALDRIELARRRKPRVREERVTAAHGAGGKATRTLVEAVFVEAFRNALLEPLGDAADLVLGGTRLAMTTDSYVVSPLFFPGGNIGDLAVNGTVNDLAVAGASPAYLSCGFILEEGFPIEDLRRIVSSMRECAEAVGVTLVAGDTKVVGRGSGDGCYVNTTGIGLLPADRALGVHTVRPGDAVLVSGPVGEHGVTVLLARGEPEFEADLVSDTAPLADLCIRLLTVPGVRAMRDATRGGVATVLNDIARAAGVSVVVEEDTVPVREEVRDACELLGVDPLYVACGGRFVAVVDGAYADEAVAALRGHSQGTEAAVIGKVGPAPAGTVLLDTAFGGSRIADLLVGDPLPRIC